jgi:hypothetical protein
MYLRTYRSFKSAQIANHQKRLGLQIENLQSATLLKFRKSNKLLRPTNLRMCYLRNFFRTAHLYAIF